MKILITGPNGFLSKNLINALKLLDFDILQISYRDSLDRYKKSIIEFSPDITIHFSWYGGNNYNDSMDLDQFYKNVPQSIELLKYLKQCNKKQTFIGLGTAFEYGRFIEPIKESTSEKPIDFYGISKLAFKNYSELFCKIEDINWIWIRPFYTYGPHDVKTRLIPKIIRAIINKETIRLDECKSKVDYLYVDDFVNCIIQIINNHQNISGVYNICSHNQYTIRDVIATISDLLNAEENIIFDPVLNKDQDSYICGDNSKIRSTINWNPTVDLKTGLRYTIKQIINDQRK